MTEAIDLGENTRQELAGFVDRIEGLNAEKAEVLEKIKAEYSEAAGAGFDKKALKQLIKERAADLHKTIEHRSTVDTYRRALGSLSGTPLGDWARGWMSSEARLKRADEEAGSVFNDWLKNRKSQDAGEGDVDGDGDSDEDGGSEA